VTFLPGERTGRLEAGMHRNRCGEPEGLVEGVLVGLSVKRSSRRVQTLTLK
jgi:hypothetical protein